MIITATLVFIVTQKYSKFMEPLILLYIISVISIFATVYYNNLSPLPAHQAFFAGYAYAMFHRLLGYKIVKLQTVIILYIVSWSVRFSLIPNPSPVLTVIVMALDIVTIFLCYFTERMERSLFDSLYKSRKDVLKFKHLITQYLPNQMAIFSHEAAQPLYMNNAFRRTFKCQNKLQVKEALDKYILEKDALEKHKTLFQTLGLYQENENHIYSLSQALSVIGNNIDALRDLGVVTFSIIEDDRNESTNLAEKPLERILDKPKETTGKIKGTLLSEGKKTPKEGTVIDINESVEKGSIRSGSTETALEEGRKRVFKVKIFPLLWDEVEAIATVFDDITQQRMVSELKVADKNKDLVIAMVSHELRTPLNGMLGLLDIARKNVQEASAQAYLGACKNSGVLMLNLINSILDLSQIKNNKLKLVYTKFPVQSLLQEVQSLFDYFCEVKKLYLTVDVMPNVPKYITTDRNRLSQILVNLLGNAFKFTFTGGITIGVDLESSNPCKLKFSVKDTGIGISKEDQERLFKMYGKLEQKNKKINTNGVGLGLTISNTLAMLLNPSENKSIQIESEVEKGTCFSFIVASQSSDNSSKHDSAASISLAECSSLGFTEDRDTTVVKKMNTYTINSVDNFNKMFTPIPSTERKPLISPTKEDLSLQAPEISSGGAHSVIKPAKTEQFLPKKKAIDLQRKGRSQMTIKETMKILKDVNNEIKEDEENNEERNWCLVVDDNPFNLMVASHIMQERGYKVKTALNGQEALDAAQQHNDNNLGFDLILMDCQMPVMDGYEATRRLKKLMGNGQLQYSPIIALTANNRDDEHEKLCNEVGMSGHVAKPLQIEELEDVLKEVRKNHK